MSTHDSMSMVYKCLSKGAVDYLLKPIRKNELKNLWQHVWRKCHSVYTPYMHKHQSSVIPAENLSHYSSFHQSIGSESESGVRTQKSTKSKGLGESDNNTGSKDGEEIGTIGNMGDGSDHGSGTQISCTKIVVEVDSPKPWEQLTDPRDTTCAQVIHSTLEELGNNWVPTGTTKECKRQGRDLDTRVPTFPNLQLEDPCEKVLTTKDGNTGAKFFEKHSKKDGEGTDKGLLELNGDNGEFRNQVAGVMSVTNISPDPQIGSAVFGIENDLSKVSSAKDKGLYQTKQIPSLELSLKRLRDIGDTGTTAHDRNVLRHSDFSAFSRYNSTSNPNQAPTGNVGSCSPLDNSSEAAKTESLTNLHSNSNGTQPNQRSNGSSNNNDMGSTTNNAFRKLIVHCDKPAPKSAIKNMHSSSAFQPVQNGHTPAAHPLGHGKANAGIDNMVLSHSRGVNQQVRVQHHHHHYHNHHHHVHNMPQQQQQQLPANHDNLSLNNMAAAAPQCGSSTALSTNVKGTTGFQNINAADGSGSDHGSNGQNGSSVALNPRGGKMDGENELAWKGGTNGGIGLGSRNGFDRNRFAQREAALNKFRQKRKERCFEKKVRYQSRKKLAEQRPRIRGQFVRQVGRENKDKDACS
ncbi:hypothetical protein K2173_020510 [Erythroxylum novogranatense]|uniref:Two-component response regulator-like PRR37 n=1 Tax=Erythroxylum novogranatense TaxID=1862640 RepID=A0AAV8TIM6_9ROSI|nr:hypothetical protein K2173_020510 [Erythroxylum novogranatense]